MGNYLDAQTLTKGGKFRPLFLCGKVHRQAFFKGEAACIKQEAGT